MQDKQLNLFGRKENCPFKTFLDEDDDQCLYLGGNSGSYDILDEEHPELPNYLADIGNVGFDDVIAKSIKNLQLPLFIPTIPRGSQKILQGNPVPWVAVSLAKIVRVDKRGNLKVVEDIRKRLGVSCETKIILMLYGKDHLIEKLWTHRRNAFLDIAKLNVDLVTGVNYSIWFDHPHPERLVNLKRSLITFEELQDLGITTVPHIYWYGKRDLERASDWIKQNKVISHIAINLQTERTNKNQNWDKIVSDLAFFESNINRPIHFLINGPSRPERINQLKAVLPNLHVSTSYPAVQAARGFLIYHDQKKLFTTHSTLPKGSIMRHNLEVYGNFMKKTSYSDSHPNSHSPSAPYRPSKSSHSPAALPENHSAPWPANYSH